MNYHTRHCNLWMSVCIFVDTSRSLLHCVCGCGSVLSGQGLLGKRLEGNAHESPDMWRIELGPIKGDIGHATDWPDLARVAAVRASVPMLAQRRHDLYQLVAKGSFTTT